MESKELERMRDILKKDNCSVTTCNNKLSLTDRLFCYKHRESWRLFCFDQGVIEKIITTSEEKQLLNHFQKETV